MSSVALPSDGFGAHPITVESHWNINPQVLEDLAQWLEQRGLRTPIGNVVGYQRERYVAFVGKSGTQSINDSTETDWSSPALVDIC